MSQIGKDQKLIEGRPKVDGSLRFGADLDRPGMLHARLVTSPYAHATLRGIDRAAALEIDGVVAVITAEDLPAVPPSSRATLLLARERVMFAGQPVALVLAESEAAAQDGAEAVFADLDPLPAVIDLASSMAVDAPAVWPEGLPGASAEAAAHGAGGGGGGAAAAGASPNMTPPMEFNRGDLEAGFAEADVVIERVFHTAPVHQSYIEPHVALVDPDPMGPGLTIYSSTQATYYIRDAVSALLGLESSQVRVVGTPVGGGFGAKFLLYEPLLALVAKAHNRPVRLYMTRLEEMLAATPAPATRVAVKIGAKSDGRLTALDAELIMDCGCFPSSMVVLAAILLGSPYQAPNQRVRGLEVLTFKASIGAYRAPCAPQAAFALESVMDEIADELGIDPVELRLMNSSKPGDPMATGQPWPSMGMREVIEAAQNHPIWTQRAEAKAKGRGVGLAVGGWPGGTEPAAAACSLQPDGTVQVHISSADISGTNTGLSQIAAEALGVDSDKVRIVTGDTTTGPFAGSSGGSKIMYTVGPAIIQAAEEARQQIFEQAAQSLEAAIEDLEIRDGKVQVKGAPDQGIPLGKIAQRTMRFGSQQAPIFGHGRHAQKGSSPGFCAQIAEVEVDHETGRVIVHKLAVIQDVGKAINPLLVKGQMFGGAVQGLGWALLEEMRYDGSGQLLTATFSDYALPHIDDSPETFDLQIVEVPSPAGPFGARGVGEPPVVPTAAAVASAIRDATGVRLAELPMSAPRVLSALASAGDIG